MKHIVWILLFSFILCTPAFAQQPLIQKVSIEPASGGISFNTITFRDKAATGWVTAPSVELRGRKGILVNNTGSSNIYLTGVSGSTAFGTLYPREKAYIPAASNLHVYVSSNSVGTVDIWEIR